MRLPALLLLLCLPAAADSPAPAHQGSHGSGDSPPADANPPATANTDLLKSAVKTLPDGKLQIGQVIIDPHTREIRFPGEINMNEGALEYALVTKTGKCHESLLATDISPTHLNLAFTLLRYKSSPELFPIPNKDREAPVKYPEVPADQKAGARINIRVEWKEGDKTHSASLNELIMHLPDEKAMPSGPWLYTGSYFSGGKYVAESAGDISAIFVDNNCILNYPGPGRDDDKVWIPFPKRVPAPETKVTIVISPNSTPSHP